MLNNEALEHLEKEYREQLIILEQEGKVFFGTNNKGEKVYLVREKDLKYI